MSKLPTYGGFAQDNLTAFIDDLTSYYSLKEIDNNNRKILILRAQLRHAAKIYADSEANSANPPDTFENWIAHLNQRFITPDVISR